MTYHDLNSFVATLCHIDLKPCTVSSRPFNVGNLYHEVMKYLLRISGGYRLYQKTSKCQCLISSNFSRVAPPSQQEKGIGSVYPNSISWHSQGENHGFQRQKQGKKQLKDNFWAEKTWKNSAILGVEDDKRPGMSRKPRKGLEKNGSYLWTNDAMKTCKPGRNWNEMVHKSGLPVKTVKMTGKTYIKDE